MQCWESLTHVGCGVHLFDNCVCWAEAKQVGSFQVQVANTLAMSRLIIKVAAGTIQKGMVQSACFELGWSSWQVRPKIEVTGQ